MNKKGFVLSTYVYILLVFFLLLLGTMLAVLNNTRLLSVKLKEQVQVSSGLIDKDFSFVLLGDKEDVIRKGEEYQDKGFKIQTSGGTDLSDNVIIKGSVDTSTVGDYNLTYTSTYNGVTKELTRIVHVLDDIAVNYISGLYQYRDDENGLIKDNTEDKNIRYAGSNDDVNNYVEFGNDGELWRIIGVFDVEGEDGVKRERVKIVRDAFTDSTGKLIDMSWDSSTDGTLDGKTPVNEGYGINQWGESTYEDGTSYEGADLMRMLNTYYIGESDTCLYCNGIGQAACENICTSSVTPLNITALNMIDEVVWKTGAVLSLEETKLLDAYIAERGTQTGKICTKDNIRCTDTVIRTTEWKGLIGLIYLSDYGYASMDVSCANDVRGADSTCQNSNWLYLKSTYWMITPASDTYHATIMYSEHGTLGGHINYGSDFRPVRPSVYLKTSVQIVSGTGTESDPYKLSL